MLKISLFTVLLALPTMAWADSGNSVDPRLETEPVEASTPEQSGDEANWIDTSHAYATDQAQALTEWMDDFFGDPDYDLEEAESQIRLQWRNSWDQKDNYNAKLKIRGKLQLPKVSQRLNLVFSGDDGDNIVADERVSEDTAGLLYNVEDGSHSRLDLTLNASSNSLRPGVRYSNKGALVEQTYYRYTQRLEYESDEGFYTTGQLNLDYAVDQSQLVRWSNRVIYGEETLGAEWRSILSLSQRRSSEINGDQRVISYYVGIEGFSDPSLVENYRVGAVLRRQVYRKFLFVELEPSYNFRKRLEDENRDGTWNIILRLEIKLEKDLRSTFSSASK